jgi:hypothetical protein
MKERIQEGKKQRETRMKERKTEKNKQWTSCHA